MNLTVRPEHGLAPVGAVIIVGSSLIIWSGALKGKATSKGQGASAGSGRVFPGPAGPAEQAEHRAQRDAYLAQVEKGFAAQQSKPGSNTPGQPGSGGPLHNEARPDTLAPYGQAGNSVGLPQSGSVSNKTETA
jgi:hypothetical protein